MFVLYVPQKENKVVFLVVPMLLLHWETFFAVQYTNLANVPLMVHGGHESFDPTDDEPLESIWHPAGKLIVTEGDGATARQGGPSSRSRSLLPKIRPLIYKTSIDIVTANRRPPKMDRIALSTPRSSSQD